MVVTMLAKSACLIFQAREFQKQWMNPRYFKNSADAREITNARRADAEKGYERIGRQVISHWCWGVGRGGRWVLHSFFDIISLSLLFKGQVQVLG